MKKGKKLEIGKNEASILALASFYLWIASSAYPLSDASGFFDVKYAAIDGILCLAIIGLLFGCYSIITSDAKIIRWLLAHQIAIMPFIIILFFRYQIDVEHKYILESLLASFSIFVLAFMQVQKLKIA